MREIIALLKLELGLEQENSVYQECQIGQLPPRIIPVKILQEGLVKLSLTLKSKQFALLFDHGKDIDELHNPLPFENLQCQMLTCSIFHSPQRKQMYQN